MRRIIMYDISDDKCRSNIAEYLEGKGVRIQESVFECDLTDDNLKIVIEKLGKILCNNPGNIRIYQLCEKCRVQTIGIGDVTTEPGNMGYAVF
jgi:CRISPR-associated protein Cas2